MYRLSAVLVSLSLLLTACSDGAVEPVLEPQSSQSVVEMVTPAQLAAAREAQARYAADRGFMASAVAPGTYLYDFTDLNLDYSCNFGDTIPNPYQDLVFLSEPALAPCGGAPVLSYGSYLTIYEVVIDLPLPAASVALDIFGYTASGPLVLTGYDATGTALATTSGWSFFGWSTLSLSGGPFAWIGIEGPSGTVAIDNLTITYVDEPEEPEEPVDPTTKADCMKGGWEQYGFRNQGQCVRFVETGKDSR